MSRIIALMRLEPGAGIRTVKLPTGTEFLSVVLKDEIIHLICKFDPSNARLSEHRFQQVLNGQPLAEVDSLYIGTVQIEAPLQDLPRGLIIPAGVDPSKMTAVQVMWVHVFYLGDDHGDDEGINISVPSSVPLCVREEGGGSDDRPRRMPPSADGM